MTCPCEPIATSIIFEGNNPFYAWMNKDGTILVKRWLHPQGQDKCSFCILKQNWQFDLNISGVGYNLISAENITDAYNKVIPVFKDAIGIVNTKIEDDIQRSTGVEPRWADIDLS